MTAVSRVPVYRQSVQVEAGQTYQHYKGQIVFVLGVADGGSPGHEWEEIGIAHDPDNHVRLCVFKRIDVAPFDARHIDRIDFTRLMFRGEQNASPIVVYSCSGRIWYRSIDEFLAILADANTGKPFNRFSLINGSTLGSSSTAQVTTER